MPTITQHQIETLSKIINKMMDLPTERADAFEAAELSVKAQGILLAIKSTIVLPELTNKQAKRLLREVAALPKHLPCAHCGKPMDGPTIEQDDYLFCSLPCAMVGVQKKTEN